MVNSMNEMSWCKNKNIVIYGRGVNAKRLIPVLLSQQTNIVGIMDKDIWNGSFENIPIICWDDMEYLKVDFMIIAAAPINIMNIYRRIHYRCEKLGISVYSNLGVNLTKKNMYKCDWSHKKAYYSKDYNQLCKEIDSHSVVSFDIFETLLMRSVWEPTDIFDLVDTEICRSGIKISDFKKKRHMAEVDTNCARLDVIYACLASSEGLNPETVKKIMDIEIDIEKKYLIPRVSMVEAYKYALSQGKEVYLISDMYLPKTVMEEILLEHGISGYKGLYISCEYDLFKSSGLYDVVRKENTISDSWLHIGDDEYIDGKSANRYGIDSYLIKSARDMLRISSLERLMLYTLSKKDRFVLGKIVVALFNNPFALHDSCGVVKVDELSKLSSLFYVPIACAYMDGLISTLKEQKYDRILFLARDGYIFKQIYERCNWIDNRVENTYLYASRRLNLLATTYDVDDIDRFGKHYGFETSPEEFWKTMTDGLTGYKNILQYCEDVRSGYIKYLDSNALLEGGDYLVCDLLSSGTIHKSLNVLLKKTQKGFYLHKTDDVYDKGLDVDSVFDDVTGESVKEYIYILENVFTSDGPSAKGCSDGEIVFLEDKRSSKHIEMLKSIHKQIVDETLEYLHIWKDDDSQISVDLLNSIIGLCKEFEYEGEAYEWVYQKITDDLVEKDKEIL